MFIPFLILVFQPSGVRAFDVSTSTPNPSVPENQGVDLKCGYSADFGTPRVEWKFNNMHGSQKYIIYDGKPTVDYVGRVEQYTGGLRFSKVTRADNGQYSCLVSGNNMYGEAKIDLTVQVPPSIPVCNIPTSVITKSQVVLTCFDKDGSPPSTYKWFKNNTPLPDNPSNFATYKNSTYAHDGKTGHLRFSSVAKSDSGQYFCTASNGIGTPMSCAPVLMQVNDLNVGGIVAAIIIALLLVALLIFALWFARRKGYLPKKAVKRSDQAYTQPAAHYTDKADGDFKQKSSFVV